jgi:glycine oxidase
VTADRVVLCAGSWAGALDPLTELRERVRPIRGQLVHVHWPSARVEHVLWGRNCYIVPWMDGTILIGATSEDVGFDERVTLAGVSSLIAAAVEMLPGIAEATLIGARVGLRPATDDGLPIIGPSPTDPRVIYATGHFRNGVLLAPLTASLLGDLIADGISDPMLAVTAVGRYKNRA